MSTGNTHWSRLNGRLSYGLLTQELLDRVARIGLICYPYYVVREMPIQRPEFEVIAPVKSLYCY